MFVPTFSVVIPTRNRAPYLGEAIESVLLQLGRMDEVIVIDDGSTDNTQEVLSEFRDHILVIRQKPKGPSAARNSGIRKAQGEWIAFQDDDDVWSSEKLDKQRSFINTHPSTDIIFGRCANFTVNKRKAKVDPINEDILANLLETPQEIKDIYILLIKENFIPLSTVVIKRSAFYEIGFFDESLLCSEDLDLWLRAAKRLRFSFINEVLTFRRLHGNNLSLDYPRRLLSQAIVLERAYKTLEDCHLREKHEIECKISRIHYNLGSFYLKRCDIKNAVDHLTKARTVDQTRMVCRVKIRLSHLIAILHRKLSMKRSI